MNEIDQLNIDPVQTNRDHRFEHAIDELLDGRDPEKLFLLIETVNNHNAAHESLTFHMSPQHKAKIQQPLQDLYAKKRRELIANATRQAQTLIGQWELDYEVLVQTMGEQEGTIRNMSGIIAAAGGQKPDDQSVMNELEALLSIEKKYTFAASLAKLVELESRKKASTTALVTALASSSSSSTQTQTKSDPSTTTATQGLIAAAASGSRSSSAPICATPSPAYTAISSSSTASASSSPSPLNLAGSADGDDDDGTDGEKEEEAAAITTSAATASATAIVISANPANDGKKEGDTAAKKKKKKKKKRADDDDETDRSSYRIARHATITVIDAGLHPRKMRSADLSVAPVVSTSSTTKRCFPVYCSAFGVR